jgi:crotonobetainyl-CoA:carnitine CoA-transferase CaiB-like acyl-CoA transferase
MVDALGGLRVLDFGRYVAGPYCAALLADLGADVIRVEHPSGGEDRGLIPVDVEQGGALYLQCNRNKRSLTLSPKAAGGREVVARLVRSADVVVANVPPKVLLGLGLDYETLQSYRPDIILTTITAWGSGGEWSDKIGFDGLAQGASGNLSLTGPPEQPSRNSAPYVDFGTAAIAAYATAAALVHRRETGEGQLIEASLYRTAITFNSMNLIEQDALEVNRRSSHNRSQIAGPADVFKTTDGSIMCQVIGPAQFQRWAQMIGRTDLVGVSSFKDDQARGDNGDQLSALMGKWCSTRSSAQCLATMERHSLSCGPVLSVQETLDARHFDQIGALESVEQGDGKTVRLVNFPATLSGTPGTIRMRAPRLGEHTDALLHELRFSDDEIAALYAAGAV